MSFLSMSFPSKRHRSMRTESYRPRNPPSPRPAIQPLSIDALSSHPSSRRTLRTRQPVRDPKGGTQRQCVLNDTAGNPAIYRSEHVRPEALRPRLPAGLPLRH